MATEKKTYEELVRENIQLREKLRFFEERDCLTGLYNTNTFSAMAEKYLKRYPEQRCQILCVDVQRFKLVNDICGARQGDELLKYLAHRLEETFRTDRTLIGRLASNLFVLLLPLAEGGEQAAEKIREIFRDSPLDMEVLPAIGLYTAEDPELPVALMCDRAVLALNSIKGNYMQMWAVYDEPMRNRLMQEQEILNGAESALRNREFRLYIQPKCSLATGKMTGAEVLVRWEHPVRGLMEPKDFMPFFEKSGFIRKMDQYIWEETAAWMQKWQSMGRRLIPVSVNVSRVDILGMDVRRILQSLVERYELEPSMLEIEITEGAYSSRTEEITGFAEDLMRQGFTVLMDDFGSGYSSLNLLKDISIDVLKLDMRFLDNHRRKSRDIVTSVVSMAKWLNLKVVAEGVENRQQVEFLLDIGCNYAQGFYYYKPMRLEAFEQLLLDEEKVDFQDFRRLKVERKTGRKTTVRAAEADGRSSEEASFSADDSVTEVPPSDGGIYG